ncbi:MAG: phenylacetate--CoA ligase family protein, partial [Acidobacteriota bacterium]
IYGYTNSIVLFTKFLARKGILLKSVCPTLKACIVTSEVLTPEEKNILTNGLGIKIINEYGASETGIIAMDNKNADLVLEERLLFTEILDEQNRPVPDGQSGRIVITALYNKAMPMIRYEIGDYGVIDTVRSGSNRKLKNLLGRVSDTIILPSGKRSPGLTFYYISRSLMEKGGTISEFIIRQKTPSTFEFDYVSAAELDDLQKNQVQEMMDLYLEPGLTAVFIRKSRIERPLSGKIKHFYSELPQQEKV